MSLHSRNAHGHFKRTILREKFEAMCRNAKLRFTFCASRCNRNAFGHLTRACCKPKSNKTRASDFARACAIETHMDKPQESIFAKIYQKKTAGNHPDQTPAFTPTTVTTPQCGHTVWGITGQVSEKKRRKTKPTNLPSQRARAHRRFNAHRCEKNMVTWFENAQNAMNKIGWLTRATGYLTGLTKHTSVLECKAVSCHHSCNQKCVGVE